MVQDLQCNESPSLWHLHDESSIYSRDWKLDRTANGAGAAAREKRLFAAEADAPVEPFF